LESQNYKWVLEEEIYFESTKFLSSKIFGRSYSTMPKWSLKFYIEHNSYVLTMSGQALISSNYFKPFEDSW